MSNEVNVLIGVPASGKSTYLKGLREKHPNLHLVSRDMYVDQYANMFGQTYDQAFTEFAKQIDQTYKEHIRLLNDRITNKDNAPTYIVFDKTNLHSHVRDREFGFYQSNGYKLTYTFFEKPETQEEINKWFDRMRSREGKTIPTGVMWRMYEDYVDTVPKDAKIKPNTIVRINNWKG